MGPVLGKGKRRCQTDGTENIDTTQLQALFQQHFESTFKPLEGRDLQYTKFKRLDAAENLVASDSDWAGLSESEDDGDGKAAVVVQCPTHRASRVDFPKEELKTFMVGQLQSIGKSRAESGLLKTAKPPSISSKKASTTKRKQPVSTDPDAVDTDAANLKKDLALQRLLKESHLLDPQSSLSHTGRNRHKALDLRLQDMGSKSSILTQQKMPLAQRKGILAKSAEKDDTRRRQAQENGVILEKAVKGKSRDISKRQRGIGAPSVGKFQGGMLKLSKKDVTDIEGPGKSLRGRR